MPGGHSASAYRARISSSSSTISEYARLFFDSVKRLEQLGGQCVEIDFTPFRTAARLLYDGAWIAERYDAVGEFIERKPDSVHPVTRQLILASGTLTAAEAFRSIHRLADARRGADEAWGDIDVLVTPTAGTIYKIADLEWDPIRLNTNLGLLHQLRELPGSRGRRGAGRFPRGRSAVLASR